MKRVFVISRLVSKGTVKDDSDKLSKYTELGWELYTSGLRVKHMCMNGEITNDDLLMTHPDRMFMYRGLGLQVIPYSDDFLQSFKGEIIDLTQNLMSILDTYNFRHLSEVEKRALRYHDAKLSFSPSKKFVCFVLRLRSWVQDRGGPVEFWLERMKEAHDAGYDVYCVGKDSEKLTPDYVINVSLEDYVGLISHNLCYASLGPSSGCMLLNHTFGKSNTEVFFFADDSKLIDTGGGIGHLLIFGIQGNLNAKKTRYYTMK
jgi:hypothetical protein